MKPTNNNTNRVLLLLITTWLTLFFSFSVLLLLLSPLLVSTTSSLPITTVDAFSSTSTSIYNKYDNNKAISTSTSTRLRLRLRSSSPHIENEKASTVTRCTTTTTTTRPTAGAIAKATLMRMTKQDDSLLTTSSTKAVTPTPTRTTQLFSFPTIVSSLRLSWLLLLFSTPAVAVTTTVISSPPITVPSTFVVATTATTADSLNVDSTNYETPEGMSAITKSALGTSVREQVVKSAKLVDSLDLKWERFSDSLRDQKKCDPLTNRRLFDNGIRSDGTPRGNPVLGALCTAVPLQALDETLINTVLNNAFDAAAYDIISNIVNQGDANANHDVVTGGLSSTTTRSTTMDRLALQDTVDQTRQRLEPAFRRAAVAATTASSSTSVSSSSSSSPTVVVDEATKRQQYNLEVYTRVRAYGEALTKSVVASSSSSTSSTPESKASSASVATYKLARKEGKKLDLLWGRNLLSLLAGPSSQKYEFQTPFPIPTDNDKAPLLYNIKELTNALGAVEVALDKLQQGGLIGHWEISIPEDDFGEVVTIAIDDDIAINAQIVAREDSPTITASLSGSPVVAMVRSAIEERAQIPYATLDVFYIDPSTTKNELYNPTQLLISIRNLGEEQ